MSGSPSLTTLQTAVYSALLSDLGIVSLAGAGKVFDRVPEGTAFPYITIGDVTAKDYDSQTFDGLETTITVHSWARGAGRKSVKSLMDRIYKILHRANLQMDGQKMILMRFEFSNGGELDPDGVTYHGVQRFRALIQGV